MVPRELDCRAMSKGGGEGVVGMYGIVRSSMSISCVCVGCHVLMSMSMSLNWTIMEFYRIVGVRYWVHDIHTYVLSRNTCTGRSTYIQTQMYIH